MMNKWRVLAMIAIVAVVVLLAALGVAGAANPLVVRMTDQCNPATFNAAVGPGTCVGDGTVTFDHFISELTSAQKAGAWHFDPENTTVEPGTALQLANRGGETHTFTKVANFGGGFVAPLNALSGNPVPAPECGTVTQGGIIPKPESSTNIFVEAGTTETGPTAGGSFLPSGSTTKVQCCIHPWMRAEIRTR
jgi:plastocyanin